MDSDAEIGDVGDDVVSESHVNWQRGRLTMPSLLSRLPFLSELLGVLCISAAILVYIRDVCV